MHMAYYVFSDCRDKVFPYQGNREKSNFIKKKNSNVLLSDILSRFKGQSYIVSFYLLSTLKVYTIYYTILHKVWLKSYSEAHFLRALSSSHLTLV